MVSRTSYKVTVNRTPPAQRNNFTEEEETGENFSDSIERQKRAKPARLKLNLVTKSLRENSKYNQETENVSPLSLHINKGDRPHAKKTPRKGVEWASTTTHSDSEDPQQHQQENSGDDSGRNRQNSLKRMASISAMLFSPKLKKLSQHDTDTDSEYSESQIQKYRKSLTGNTHPHQVYHGSNQRKPLEPQQSAKSIQELGALLQSISDSNPNTPGSTTISDNESANKATEPSTEGFDKGKNAIIKSQAREIRLHQEEKKKGGKMTPMLLTFLSRTLEKGFFMSYFNPLQAILAEILIFICCLLIITINLFFPFYEDSERYTNHIFFYVLIGIIIVNLTLSLIVQLIILISMKLLIKIQHRRHPYDKHKRQVFTKKLEYRYKKLFQWSVCLSFTILCIIMDLFAAMEYYCYEKPLQVNTYFVVAIYTIPSIPGLRIVVTAPFICFLMVVHCIIAFSIWIILQQYDHLYLYIPFLCIELIAISCGYIAAMFEEHNYRVLYKIMKQTQFETRLAEIENRRSDFLLNVIFPLEYKEDFFNQRHKNLPFIQPQEWATCVITDVVNFTSWCFDRSSKQVVHVLNDHFSAFDDIIAKYEMVKVKTIGDSYFFVNLLNDQDHNRETTLTAAQSLLDVMDHSNQELKQNLTMRVGVAEGPIYITLYGSMKVTFDCFGQAVTMAEYLEQTGQPSRIHVCEAIVNHSPEFQFEAYKPKASDHILEHIGNSYLLVHNDEEPQSAASYQTTIQQYEETPRVERSKLILDVPVMQEVTIDELSSNYSRHTEIRQQRDDIDRTKHINYIAKSCMCTFDFHHDLGMNWEIASEFVPFFRLQLLANVFLYFFIFGNFVVHDYKNFIAMNTPWFHFMPLIPMVINLVLFVVLITPLSKIYIVLIFSSLLSIMTGFGACICLIFSKPLYMLIGLVLQSFVLYNTATNPLPVFVRDVLIILETILFIILDFMPPLNNMNWFKFNYSVILLALYLIFRNHMATPYYTKSYYKRIHYNNLFSGSLDKIVENDYLITSVLPFSVAERLSKTGSGYHENYTNASVCFVYIEGFQKMFQQAPESSITILTQLFDEFDFIVQSYHCEKIKCTQEVFIFFSKTEEPNSHHTIASTLAALDIQLLAEKVLANNNLSVKIGLHSGNFTGGVLGSTKFLYDIFGTTVNLASRMATTSESASVHASREFVQDLHIALDSLTLSHIFPAFAFAGHINSMMFTIDDITERLEARKQTLYQFWDGTTEQFPHSKIHIRDLFVFKQRGVINIKGKGEMFTYYILPSKAKRRMVPEEKVESPHPKKPKSSIFQVASPLLSPVHDKTLFSSHSSSIQSIHLSEHSTTSTS